MNQWTRRFLAIDAADLTLDFVLDTIKNLIACAVLISGGVYLYNAPSEKNSLFAVVLIAVGALLAIACLGRFYWLVLKLHLKKRGADLTSTGGRRSVPGDLVGFLMVVVTVAIYKFFAFIVTRYLGT